MISLPSLFRALTFGVCVLGASILSASVASAQQATPAAVQPIAAFATAASALIASADAVAQTEGGLARVSAAMPHDLSPWSMFVDAHIVVKAVMVSLMFASLVTWTILFGKSIELGAARRRLAKGVAIADHAVTIAAAKMALDRHQTFLHGLIAMTEREMQLAPHASTEAGLKERCDSQLSEMVRLETQGMRRGMGLLATIGSTAPFVGLFGTVWGIMTAFIGISKAQTTNLAVVAPGIAEALLATAIGLVAAIPAVIIYNHFSQVTRRYQSLVARAAGTVRRLLSRELDRRHGAPRAAAAE